MILTNKQELGLKIAVQRYLDGEKFTVISGYAGSGKSTLVKYIIAALSSHGVDPNMDVGFCAYTGKAAEVLRQKGNPNCKTAHKLLYKTIPTNDGRFIHMPVDEIESKVVVVDECSMLPLEMADLLLSYNVYVIFCGDPGQLPPIDKSQNNHLLDKPHVFLDEIMRQAQESGIIRLSMMIRNGEDFSNFDAPDVKILPKSALNEGMLTWADQILCATNNTRNTINQTCRKIYGYEGIIEPGEKLIALKNDWDRMSDIGGFLTNGCIGTLEDVEEHKMYIPRYFNFMKLPFRQIPYITGNFVTDFGDNFGVLPCDIQCITTGEPALTSLMKYKFNRSKAHFPGYVDLEELTYGYCITVWKYQGSEAPKILGIEEDHPFDKKEHTQYLYTMATRATDKLVMIRKDD